MIIYLSIYLSLDRRDKVSINWQSMHLNREPLLEEEKGCRELYSRKKCGERNWTKKEKWHKELYSRKKSGARNSTKETKKGIDQ